MEGLSAFTSRGEEDLNGWLLLRVTPQVFFVLPSDCRGGARKGLTGDLIEVPMFSDRWRAQLIHGVPSAR